MRKERWGLLLAPGAAASSDAHSLLAIEAMAPANVVVRRMDFPYRLAGRRIPDAQPILLASLVHEARAFARRKRIPMRRIFVGGRSMGGRMASLAVAEGLGAAGLVLISYPLHPPGKREKLRVDHFPQLDLPCLVVSGTNDSFGTRGEFNKHLKAIPGDVTQHWIPRGDHSLRRHDDVTARAVRDWLEQQTT